MSPDLAMLLAFLIETVDWLDNNLPGDLIDDFANTFMSFFE